LVNSDDLSVVGEHHHVKYKRGDCLHSIHLATSKKYIVIEWGIDKDGFPPDFSTNILKEPFRRGWSSIVSSQSDGEGYYLERFEFPPYHFGHDACGCTFIDDALMNYDVLNFDGYMERYQSRETGFPTI
jgi:hypothetical protein